MENVALIWNVNVNMVLPDITMMLETQDVYPRTNVALEDVVKTKNTSVLCVLNQYVEKTDFASEHAQNQSHTVKLFVHQRRRMMQMLPQMVPGVLKYVDQVHPQKISAVVR